MACLDVFHAHALPVEEVGETLGTVTLVDALAAGLLRKVEHVVGELIDGLVDGLHATVDDVDAVVGRVLNQLLHVAAEAGKVGGDAGYAHDGTLGGGVAPWLVVGGKDTEMGSADKVVVVEGKDGVGGVEEFGVEDDLDAVGGVVEELDAADLGENWVVSVVNHVVGDDGGERVALHGVDATLEHNLLLVADELLLIGQVVALVPAQRPIKEPLANALLNDLDRVVKGLDDSLTLERLNCQGRGLSGHDNEGDHSHLRTRLLEPVVQAGERLDKHVDTLIPVLVATGSEEVESIVEVEIIVAVEMTANKVVNLLLALGVQVLELMHGRELDDIETVGEDAIGLALQEMLALKGGDVGDGGEDVAGVSSGTLNAVPVVDATLARFGIDIEVLEVVVEIDGAGAEISSEKRSVGRKDSGDVNPPLTAKRQTDTSEPLVEVRDNRNRPLAGRKLPSR